MPVDYSRYEPDWVKEFKRCEQWLENALDYAHGTFDISDVFEEVMNGNAQFWPGKNSAVVTQIVNYPRKKAIHFFLAGGDIKELEEKLKKCGLPVKYFAKRLATIILISIEIHQVPHHDRTAARILTSLSIDVHAEIFCRMINPNPISTSKPCQTKKHYKQRYVFLHSAQLQNECVKHG